MLLLYTILTHWLHIRTVNVNKLFHIDASALALKYIAHVQNILRLTKFTIIFSHYDSCQKMQTYRLLLSNIWWILD